MPDAPLTNRIELTGDPSSGALRIDGHLLPFSAAVLRLEAPNTPVLSVALPVIGGAVVTLDAETGFEETTAAALVAMGWTPPPEAPVGTGRTWLTATCRRADAYGGRVSASAITRTGYRRSLRRDRHPLPALPGRRHRLRGAPGLPVGHGR